MGEGCSLLIIIALGDGACGTPFRSSNIANLNRVVIISELIADMLTHCLSETKDFQYFSVLDITPEGGG